MTYFAVRQVELVRSLLSFFFYNYRHHSRCFHHLFYAVEKVSKNLLNRYDENLFVR